MLPNEVIEVRLTTQDYNYPEGLKFPTVAGAYKVDFKLDHVSIGIVRR